MSTVAITAPSGAPPVPAGAAQRSTLPPDGRWQSGLRRPAAAARLAGHAPQGGADLPYRLLAEMAGRFARLACRYQAYFCFPLLLTALGLHIDSAIYLARRTGRSRTWQQLLFAADIVATSPWCS